MRGTSTWSRCVVVLAFVAACGAADNRVDPADLELRDLLGVAPEVAIGWDAAQRAAARRVLASGLAAGPVVVAPEPRLAVIAAYVERAGALPELLVNPVLLAARDPDPLEATTAAALGRATLDGSRVGAGARPEAPTTKVVAATGG